MTPVEALKLALAKNEESKHKKLIEEKIRELTA